MVRITRKARGLPPRKPRGDYDGYASTTPSEAGSLDTSYGTKVISQKTTDSSTEITAASKGTVADESVTPAQRPGTHKTPKTIILTPLNRLNSKTSIARLTYHLNTLPKLYIIEVEIQSYSSRVRPDEKIWSRKLREKALHEFVSDSEYDAARKYVAFDTRAERGSSLIIVCLPGNTEQADRIKSLLPRSNRVLNDTHRRVLWRDGKIYNEEILCSVEDARTISQTSSAKLYRRCLDVLVRKRATELPPRTKYGIDNDFFNTLESTDPTDIDVSATKRNRNWELTLRNTPRIHRLRKVLYLNYDLDIVVPVKKRVYDILFDILGCDTIDESSAAQLSFIRRFLVDLQVRCAYTSPEREAMVQGKRGELSLLDGPDPKSRQFRITEVRPHSEVDDFIPQGFDGLESV